MKLTKEEQAMLDGRLGQGMASAMKVLVGIGKAFGAEEMTRISKAHISLSNQEGDLWFVENLVSQGAKCTVAPTVNPAYDYEYFKDYCKIDEVDKDIIERTIDAYRELGAILTFDCTPYFENNVPRFGEICAFSASGGAVHVNSVCGARTNREAAQSALCAAITGRTPVYGMLKTENRKGDILVEVEAEIKTEFDYELLGYYTPLKMGASYHVPVFGGLSKDTSQEALMNLGTQINIHGVVPMYHVVGVTPEAASLEDAFHGEKIPATITITKKDIQKAYDLISKGHGKVDFCILGCPHLTIQQVKGIADMLKGKKLAAQLYIFTSSLTKELAERMGLLQTIREAGGDIVKDSCVDQPCWSHLYGKSGITESPKCAYYTTRRNLSFLVRSIPECIEAALKGEI